MPEEAAVDGGPSASLPWEPAFPGYILTGMAAAQNRAEKAWQSGSREACFVAVSEVVMWVMVLDERRHDDAAYVAVRDGSDAGQIVVGLRHIWNCLKHTTLDHLMDRAEGFSFPMTFPMTFFEMRWRPFDDLPPVKRRNSWTDRQEDAYRSHLAGKMVRTTLPAAVNFMHAAGVKILGQGG